MVPVKPHMKPPPNQPRVLSVNEGHKHGDYKGNYVSTTKYNVFTYFPKALFEQFRWVDFSFCTRFVIWLNLRETICLTIL